MNAQPEDNKKSAASQDKASLRYFFKSMPKRLLRLMLHNWPWKLLALFLALCLWAGLITQDPTLTRERIFSDVNVTVTGSDTLRRNGLIVLNDFTVSPVTARLRVDVPQREYNTVQAANYNPRIDLSKISQTGAQTVRISATSTTTYGSVKEISPETVELEVDEYITRYRIPVTVNRVGSYPAGFYGTTPALDPSSVVISGPKSLVTQISRVTVNFDVSALPGKAGLVRTSVPIELTSLSGEPMVSELLQVTSESVLLRSITVEQTLYPTKTLALSNLSMVTGAPKEGYEVKSVSATPSTVMAAGDESALAALDAIFVDEAVDVSGMSEPFTAEVKLRKPSELTYLSTDTVTMYIDIGPVITSKTFSGVNLSYKNLSDGLSAKLNLKSADVTLTGPSLMLGGIKASHLTPYVELSGLDEGEYGLPIFLTISRIEDSSAITYAMQPDTASVTITKK